MRIAEMIGTVTLSRCHPSLAGYRWIIGVPFSLKGIRAELSDGEDLIVLDELGAGQGQRIAISDGAEAAQPFHPAKKAVDAYCACLLDSVTVSDEK